MPTSSRSRFRWRPVRKTVSRRYNPAAISGTNWHIALPSACSSKVVKPTPKRAVISWRPREATSPMVFNPARRSPPVIASSAPSVNTGSGATAKASSPWAIIPEGWRVNVRARMKVEATAALTIKPRRPSASHSNLQQRAFAAEQMRAAGNVEMQTVRWIERHQRREAVAQSAMSFERLARPQPRQHRTPSTVGTDRRGIGERQPDRRPRRAARSSSA